MLQAQAHLYATRSCVSLRHILMLTPNRNDGIIHFCHTSCVSTRFSCIHAKYLCIHEFAVSCSLMEELLKARQALLQDPPSLCCFDDSECTNRLS